MYYPPKCREKSLIFFQDGTSARTYQNCKLKLSVNHSKQRIGEVTLKTSPDKVFHLDCSTLQFGLSSLIGMLGRRFQSLKCIFKPEGYWRWVGFGNLGRTFVFTKIQIDTSFEKISRRGGTFTNVFGQTLHSNQTGLCRKDTVIAIK